MAGGALVGYGTTGSIDGALMGASFGQMGGSIAAHFAVACFTAGTPLIVDLEGHSRPIDEIEVGEFVLARSEFDPDGPLELKRVEEKFVRTAVVMELVVHGQSIKTTAEHPFYVPAQGKFVVAGELQVGEQLVGHDGKLVQIESIGSTGEVTTVYNLRVADFHTYFVGGTIWGWDAWVHNASYSVRAFAGERQARTLLEKRDYEILATLSNRNGNGLDIIARNKKGKLRFFEVKTTKNGDIALSPAQSKGAQTYVWEQLRLAAGYTKHKQEWRWAEGNLRGSHVRDYAQDLIDELDDLAGGRGRGKTAIQGAFIKFTNWSGTKNSGSISIHRW
jgi:Holliday junction resolvase-like predicted endonuclease